MTVMDQAAQLAERLEARCPWNTCAKLWTHASWRDLIDTLRAVSPDTYEVWKKDLLRDEAQPTFPLVAQDVTADLVVDFWTLVQLRVWAEVKAGSPLEDAVAGVRQQFGIPFYPPCLHLPKLDGASQIACEMRAWPYRRLAD